MTVDWAPLPRVMQATCRSRPRSAVGSWNGRAVPEPLPAEAGLVAGAIRLMMSGHHLHHRTEGPLRKYRRATAAGMRRTWRKCCWAEPRAPVVDEDHLGGEPLAGVAGVQVVLCRSPGTVLGEVVAVSGAMHWRLRPTRSGVRTPPGEYTVAIRYSCKPPGSPVTT